VPSSTHYHHITYYQGFPGLPIGFRHYLTHTIDNSPRCLSKSNKVDDDDDDDDEEDVREEEEGYA